MIKIKNILTIIFVLFCNLANAQTEGFVETKSIIEQQIEKEQWDNIILLASDLLIEEPNKGDGYYYISLAFFNMGQADKATAYLQQAEALKDVSIQSKIDELKTRMQASTSEASDVLNAEKLTSEGKLKEAAVLWEKIWTNNKKNLDYALNAVAIYTKLKLFPEALAILNDPTVANDSEAIELIQRINETKQMKSINGYTESMSKGLALMKVEKYEAALQKFEAALSFRSNDKEALIQKNIVVDKIAWSKAHKTYTIESFENYLNGNTLLNYAKEAHGNIKIKLVNLGKQQAADLDIPNMEKTFNKYLINYPNGADVANVKQMMCDAYYRKGNLDALSKTNYSQATAVENFVKARKICIDKSNLNSKIKHSNRLATRYGRPDRFYYTYAYDERCNIGFSWGSINNTSVGAFVTVRCNSNFFSSAGPNGNVNNKGVVTGGQYVKWGNDWRFKDEIRTGLVESVVGITKKVTYPFWIYSGVGVSYKDVAWKMAIYDNLGDYFDTDWVNNSDESKIAFASEAGMILDLNGLNVRTGLKTNDFKDFMLTIGVGLSFKRKW